MTKKVAFMNVNDNDYHLDLQVKIQNRFIDKYIYLQIIYVKDNLCESFIYCL